jgi:hypothetical protein
LFELSELRLGHTICVELFLAWFIQRRLRKSADFEICVKPPNYLQGPKKISLKLYAFRVPTVRLYCHKLFLYKNGLIIYTHIWQYVKTKEEGIINGAEREYVWSTIPQ